MPKIPSRQPASLPERNKVKKNPLDKADIYLVSRQYPREALQI